MEYRIDGVVNPPGLITGVKSFSLILRDEGLYVIHSDPVGDQPHGCLSSGSHLIQSGVINATALAEHKQGASKPVENETKLSGLSKTPGQQAHCRLLTTDQISEIFIKENRREIVLEICSSLGTYTFRLPIKDITIAETLKQRLQP